jgi:hypothetical protein
MWARVGWIIGYALAALLGAFWGLAVIGMIPQDFLLDGQVVTDQQRMNTKFWAKNMNDVQWRFRIDYDRVVRIVTGYDPKILPTFTIIGSSTTASLVHWSLILGHAFLFVMVMVGLRGGLRRLVRWQRATGTSENHA